MSDDQQKTGTVTRRDLAGTEIERRAETAATAAAAQVRAQMEFHYLMALRSPRDWDEVELRLLRECDRPAFAREALYNKPIGKGVMGLSIRFAEKALMCMRNVASDTIVTFDDDQKRIVRQVVTDFESNVAFSKDVTVQKTVERRELRQGQEAISRRMNSTGQIVYLVAASEDDLLNKEGALVSKALRTNVLRILPGDIQASCEERIREVLKKQNAQDPEGRKKAYLSAFFELGVKPAEVVEYLGHNLDAPITDEEYAALLGLRNAIKDGETNMREAIEIAKAQRGEKPAEEEEKPGASATDKLKGKLKKQKGGIVTAEGDTVPLSGETAPAVAAEYERRLLALAEGNRSEADIELSAATAGKIQKLSDLGAALAEKPGWGEFIEEYLKRKEEK